MTYGAANAAGDGDGGNQSRDQPKFPLVCSWRFVVVIVAFVGAVLHATMRNMIGMTMVCMVNATDGNGDDNDTLVSDLLRGNRTNKISTAVKCRPPLELTDDYHHGEFEWTKDEQNFVISANAVGQLVGLSLAGMATHNLWLMFVATLFGSIFTFIFPMAAHMGSNYAFYSRVGVGVCTGISWPCIHTIIGKWCHKDELSYLNSLVSGGRQISVVVSTPVAAYFCKQFYLWGGVEREV
uniref:Uncharacterized protein n=1 Tax=Romanomermis culicivorax TaxID=13658 RepID=A0A915L8W7_ROMCU